MYNDEELEAAIIAGIFTENSVAAFRKFTSQNAHTAAVDEEHFRLVSGFNDIFVSIASLLLLISAGWLGSQLALPLGFFLVTGISWALAEFFVIKRRLALPAIVLLVTFVGGLVGFSFFMLFALEVNEALSVLVAGLVGAIAAKIHWDRFKVPITVAVGAAGIVGCSIAAVVALKSPDVKFVILPLLFAGGILSFVTAMYWDSQDTSRKTRKSDVAFWLHLLSAPLIVHPIFSSLGVLEAESSIFDLVVVIFLYVAMGLLSIAIDRRALMVSSLVYVLYAFTALLKTYGFVGVSFAISGFFIGAMLLLLSAFWQKSREMLLSHVPGYYRKWLPPLT